MKQEAYSLEGTAQQLLAELDRAQAEDDVAERQSARWRRAAGVVLVGGIVTLVTASILESWLVPGPLAVLGLVAAAFMFLRAKRHGRSDVDDRKLGSARRVLRVLQADIPAGWPVALALDLRRYDDARSPIEADAEARTRRWEQTWFELRANLADGCALVAQIRDDVKRKEKPKSKRTKVVERFDSEVVLRLRLARRYGPAEALAADLQAVPRGRGFKVLASRGCGRALLLRAGAPRGQRISNRGLLELDMDQLADGDTLLQALHFVYGEIGAHRARVA